MCRAEKKGVHSQKPCPVQPLASSASHAPLSAPPCLSSQPCFPLQMLLPAVTADGLSASDAVAAMDACCPDGTSLLHVAVGTGSAPLVQCLSDWGATRGRPWLVDAPAGSAGVTPLHVAALLPNSAAMRQALAGMAPSVDKLWGLVQAQDGTTPESLCEALAAAAAAAPEASAASTASASSSAGTSSAAMEQQPSGSKPAAELEALVEGEHAEPAAVQRVQACCACCCVVAFQSLLPSLPCWLACLSRPLDSRLPQPLPGPLSLPRLQTLASPARPAQRQMTRAAAPASAAWTAPQ